MLTLAAICGMLGISLWSMFDMLSAASGGRPKRRKSDDVTNPMGSKHGD